MQNTETIELRIAGTRDVSRFDDGMIPLDVFERRRFSIAVSRVSRPSWPRAIARSSSLVLKIGPWRTFDPRWAIPPTIPYPGLRFADRSGRC